MSKYIPFFKVMGWVFVLIVIAIGSLLSVSTLVYSLLLDFTVRHIFTVSVGTFMIIWGAYECSERILSKALSERKWDQIVQ